MQNEYLVNQSLDCELKMSDSLRDKAVGVLRSAADRPSHLIFKAILDLRRNPKPKDDALLIPLLNHSDDMIVAAALSALCNVHGLRENLANLIEKLALGDPRDTGEMPIQTEAIENLSQLAKIEKKYVRVLQSIAESKQTALCPRSRAWQQLAEICECEWRPEFTEQMILDPESKESKEIYDAIRSAALRKYG